MTNLQQGASSTRWSAGNLPASYPAPKLYVIRQWKDGNIAGLTWHLDHRRIPYEIIEAYDCPQYPQLGVGDAVIALGGPASVCRMREPGYESHFILEEERFLNQARELGLPFLGICLGHQLRAKMDDNPVETRELVFGVQEVELSAAGRQHWLFAGVPQKFRIYQHHRDHVVAVNHGAQVLASSPSCPIEAVAWSDSSVSVQFHPEFLNSHIEDAIRRYPRQLEASGLSFDGMMSRLPDDYMHYINQIFDNFLNRAQVTNIRLAA